MRFWLDISADLSRPRRAVCESSTVHETRKLYGFTSSAIAYAFPFVPRMWELNDFVEQFGNACNIRGRLKVPYFAHCLFRALAWSPCLSRRGEPAAEIGWLDMPVAANLVGNKFAAFTGGLNALDGQVSSGGGFGGSHCIALIRSR